MSDCLSLTQMLACRAGTAGHEITAHLASCDSCRNRLQQLHDDETFAAELHAIESETRVLGQPALPSIHGFEIVAEIGRGGMGVVYDAIQADLKRHVALKVLPSLLQSLRPDSAARFKAEAAAAASLHHPNIVPIYAYGESDGCHYYAMELIRGVPLCDLIREYAQHPPERAFYRRAGRWMAEVAEALAFAHARGILHRDIKPSNLILCDSDRLLITDFGLARDLTDDGQTQTGDMVGTWRYMSPEQVRGDGRPLDPRTDVYALGATLYELLAFRPAIGGPSHEVLHRVVQDVPIPPRRINPAAPRGLETICLKALAKDPDRRYDTVADLALDLRRYLDDRPISARGPLWPTRIGLFLRRHPVRVAAALVLALLITSAVAASAWLEATRRAAEYRDETVALSLTLARNHLDTGQYHRAIAVYNQALAANAEVPYAYGLRARAHGHLGNDSAGIADLTRAIAYTPDRATLYENRGILRLLSGDHTGAGSDFATAARLHPARRQTAVIFAALAALPQDPGRSRAALAHDAAMPPPLDVLQAVAERWRAGADDDAIMDAAQTDAQRVLIACLLGDLARIAGEPGRARHWFAACAALPRSPYFARLYAARRGAALDAPP